MLLSFLRKFSTLFFRNIFYNDNEHLKYYSNDDTCKHIQRQNMKTNENNGLINVMLTYSNIYIHRIYIYIIYTYNIHRGIYVHINDMFIREKSCTMDSSIKMESESQI